MSEIELHSEKNYSSWVNDLKQRYLSARLQAATAVNTSLLKYYWSIGKDIAEKQYNNTYGSGFFKQLSQDLRIAIPDAKGFSVNNLRYMLAFYLLYSQKIEKLPQAAGILEEANRLHGVDNFEETNRPQGVDNSTIANHPQPADDFTLDDLCSIPWDHHRRIIDKCGGDVDRALFYVRKTKENNWGRNVLLHFLDSGLYERDGKAITNFASTLPDVQSDLAQQITKDAYTFDFLTLTDRYTERELEDALIDNVTQFLLELGTGFSYMGRQVRIDVNGDEFFPDLLFYNARIHAYCVIELKTTSFKPEYLGQLSFYVSAINHQMKTEIDNPTIGLLICKDKNSVVAKYALDVYKEPMGVSEFQLEKLYPTNFKSSLPTIEEIEKELSDKE